MVLFGIRAQWACGSIDTVKLGIRKPGESNEALVARRRRVGDKGLESGGVGRTVGDDVAALETDGNLFAFR